MRSDCYRCENWSYMPLERPVTRNERLILDRVLDFEFPGAKALRRNAERSGTQTAWSEDYKGLYPPM